MATTYTDNAKYGVPGIGDAGYATVINATIAKIDASVGIDVAANATGGAGTVGSPWTGWTSIIATAGRAYYFRSGYYAITSTLVVPVGAQLIGETADFINGTGTILTAASMSGSTAVMTMTAAQNNVLANMLIYGRSAGATGGAIRYIGTCRSCIVTNVLVTDASSDGGCFSFEPGGGFQILFQFDTVRTGNAAYGFKGTLGNSAWTNVYANGHTIDGFQGRLEGTYTEAHAESNDGYGFNLDAGIKALFFGGSAENNGKAAFRFNNWFSAEVRGAYLAGNNALGNAAMPSAIELSNGMAHGSFSTIYEASVGAGTVYSVANTAGTAAGNCSFISCGFNKPFDATMAATAQIYANTFYIGGKAHYFGTAAPASGTWAQGDIVWHTAPVAAGSIGFVCVTAGTPGTWKTFGAIAA